MNKFLEGYVSFSGKMMTNEEVKSLEKKFPPVSPIVFENRVKALTDLMESKGFYLTTDIFEIGRMSMFNGDMLDPRPGGHLIKFEKRDYGTDAYVGIVRFNPWHIWHMTDDDFAITLARWE